MMIDSKSPVAFFVYNRIAHTRKSLSALSSNVYAKETEIHIFSDGPKTDKDLIAIRKVRKYIRNFQVRNRSFRKVFLYEREANFGLSNSLVHGINSVLKKYKTVIILEDDLVTSKFFLKFMNDSLEIYRNSPKVISIHGYVYPIEGLPTTFFMRGADCWGWATWRRGWKFYNKDAKFLYQNLKVQNLDYSFNYNNSFNFLKMLKDSFMNKNNSWAIRWHASAFLNNKLTLYPGISLVKNIGNDNSGDHCISLRIFDQKLPSKAFEISKIRPEESFYARKLFINFFNSNNLSWHQKFYIPIKKLIIRLF
ncbi:hypothetical protein MCEET85_00843 [Candidatus Methylopumilus planktonicus]|uniref:glycosyltransferase family 2 protein n=1 Tax=Candidatus Methylopumilus planktonicus TaxID=1581557 RepID=UPI003BEF20EB